MSGEITVNGFETLALDINGSVATLTLTRPKCGNALDAKAGQELKQALGIVAAATAPRLLVLKAEGKAFCAGGDIGEFASLTELSPAIRSMVIDFHGACATLAGLDIPVLAIVQGPVAGAGLALIGLADFVIASRDATFTYAYPGIGFSADGGVTWLLPKLMGLRAFQSFVIGGKSWSCDQAEAAGLVSESCQPDELAGKATDFIARIAQGPTRAYGAIRRLAFESYGLPYAAHLDREMNEIAQIARGEDPRRAIRSVLSRQAPSFEGR